MYGLSVLDIIIIALYFLGMIGIGLWSMRRIKSQEDYFLGERKFGKVIQVFAAFGQATSSDSGPSVATTTFNNGAAGVWSALLMLFATPFFWLTGVWYRRLRIVTMGDFFKERYASKGLAGTYAIISSIGLMILLSIGLLSITKTVMVMTPKAETELTINETTELERAVRLDSLKAMDFGILTNAQIEDLATLSNENPSKTFSHINKNLLILIIVIIVCLYAVLGGLEAALVSDLVQGVFIIILSFMLIPFAFSAINEIYGGEGMMDAFKNMHEQLPTSFFEIFGSPYSVDFTWYYILAVAFMALINVSAQANHFVTPGVAKNEYAARFGLTFGSYLKRFTTILWGLTALAAVLLYSNDITDPDLLWGHASKELLGPLNLGLVGLMVASLTAALMSTADMLMITTSALLTTNVYKVLLPNKSDLHYLRVGRILGGSVVIGAALMVIYSDSILSQLKLWWEFGVIFSGGFWLGILWRRIHKKAVWVSLISTLTVFFLIPIVAVWSFPFLSTNVNLIKQTKERTEVRTYLASKGDVLERNREIEIFETSVNFKNIKVLNEGDIFSKTYKLPQKAIFWTGGVRLNSDGQLEGAGLLSLELVLLDKIGFDLSSNAYALNETLRVLIRTIFPFILLILLSYTFKQSTEERIRLNRFFVKMKVPTLENPIDDKKVLEDAYKNPHQYNYKKMFTGSDWEVLKWNKTDSYGFIISIGVVFALLAFLYLVMNIGGKIII